jgi:hypothetical protein
VTQLVGLLAALGLVSGLVLWGNRRWPLLLLATAWFVIFLLPLGRTAGMDASTINNRYVYLSLMGYFIVVACILSGLVESAIPKQLSWGLIIGGLLLATPVAWVQLQPYMHSSQETRSIMVELTPLLPRLPSRTLQFDLQNFPVVDRGTYVFWQGLNDAMLLFNGQPTRHVLLEGKPFDPHGLRPPPGTGGIFYVAFTVDPKDQLHHVAVLTGTTAAMTPVAGDHIWSFSACSQDALARWLPNGGVLNCPSAPVKPPPTGGTYAQFRPSSGDGKLVLSGIDIDLSGAKWIRLAVCERSPAGQDDRLGEWFWPADGQSGWGEEWSRTFYLDITGSWRTYWAYIPASNFPTHLEAVRFDPVNDTLPIDIQWISLGVVR